MLAGLDLRPFLGQRSLGVPGCALPLGDRGVPFADGTFARREARLRLLMARLERRALALELALPLADSGKLFRQLSSCFGAFTLGRLELVDAALSVAGELLDACVFRDDVCVAFHELGLLSLQLRKLLLEHRLAFFQILRPPLDLALAV